MGVSHLSLHTANMKRINNFTRCKPATNKCLEKYRGQYLIEALCLVTSGVLADSFVLRNLLLCQAEKSCVLCYWRTH